MGAVGFDFFFGESGRDDLPGFLCEAASRASRGWVFLHLPIAVVASSHEQRHGSANQNVR